MQVLLGLFNVFLWIVPKFVRKAAPLSGKLGKNQPFQFECLKRTEMDALETVPHWLLSPPIPWLLKPNGHCMLDTDAYDKKVVCGLLEEQPEGPASSEVLIMSVKQKINRHSTQGTENVSLLYGPSYHWYCISKGFCLQCKWMMKWSSGYCTKRAWQESLQNGFYDWQNLTWDSSTTLS